MKTLKLGEVEATSHAFLLNEIRTMFSCKAIIMGLASGFLYWSCSLRQKSKINGFDNLVPRVISFFNMAEAGEKTLGHSNLNDRWSHSFMDRDWSTDFVQTQTSKKALDGIHPWSLVRADSAETKLKEMDTGLQFSNAEVEDLKTQSRNNQQSIVSLKERLLYQEVYNRRENLRFFGLPESTESTIEDSREVLYRFLERDLDIEGSRNIEFQGVHRLGRKKEGTSRPIIARFLRYPDRERVFKAALEAQDEIDVKVYADLPKEIQENRKKQ